MTRRAVLHAVRSGERDPADVCDAHRELRRAGEHLGEPRDEPCPVCAADTLRAVQYVFPTRGRHRASGRALAREGLVAYVLRNGESRVFTVEVCHACGWHHLLEGYWLVPNAPRGQGRASSGDRPHLSQA